MLVSNRRHGLLLSGVFSGTTGASAVSFRRCSDSDSCRCFTVSSTVLTWASTRVLRSCLLESYTRQSRALASECFQEQVWLLSVGPLVAVGEAR